MNERIFARVENLTAACDRRSALTFAVVAALLILDHFILGPYSYLKWHDLGDGHFPHVQALAQSSVSYGLYYWFPYAASGVDNLATGQRFFDFSFFAFRVLPDWLVIPVSRFCQLFLAGWFTFKICRENLELPAGASLVGGLFFAVYQINLMEYYFGMGAMAFIAWAVEKLHGRKAASAWLIALALGLLYAFTTPFHLSIPYSIPVIFVWLFFVRGLRTLRLIFLFAAVVLPFLVLQADMILAMVYNSKFSLRAFWVLELQAAGALAASVIESVQHYFPLIALMVLGAVLAGTRNRPLLVLAALVAGFFAISVADVPLRMALSTQFEIFRGFHFNRFVEFLSFFLSFGAAWGLHEILQWLAQRKETRLAGLSMRRLLLLTVAVAIAYFPVKQLAVNTRDWVMWGSYTSIFRSPAMEAVAREYRESPVPFRVATTQENGLQAAFANVYGLETADGHLDIYPYIYKRFWQIVTEPFLRRNVEAREYFGSQGNRISLATDDGHDLKINVDNYFRVNLLALANVRYIFSSVPLISDELELLPETKPQRFWDELSAREKISKRLSENFSGREMLVYRNRSELPRWYLAGNVAFYATEEDRYAFLTNTPAASLAETVLLDQRYRNEVGKTEPSRESGRIEPELYSPDRIVLKVSAPTRSVLVLSNTYNPFWRVTVNGEKKDILPAYGTFWGVVLDAGDHVVEFRYEPPYRFF